MGFDDPRAVSSKGSQVSMSFRIDVAERIVRSVVVGDLDAEDAVEVNARLVADPDFDPDLDHLCDLTRVERVPLDSAGIDFVVTSSPFSAASRQAIVVSDKTTYGLTRMFQSHAEGTLGELRIFHTIEDAHAWLRDT
jgi:hypothetical protein